MRPWQKKHVSVSCWTWATAFTTAHWGTAAIWITHLLKCCDELARPHVTLRVNRGAIQGGERLTRGTRPRLQSRQQRTSADTFRQIPRCLSDSFCARGKTVQCGNARKNTKNLTTSDYVVDWLTWFPSYHSSARLLIHPFSLMSYTTKRIDALGYYGPCKRWKIPALWQVAIKSLRGVTRSRIILVRGHIKEQHVCYSWLAMRDEGERDCFCLTFASQVILISGILSLKGAAVSYPHSRDNLSIPPQPAQECSHLWHFTHRWSLLWESKPSSASTCWSLLR